MVITLKNYKEIEKLINNRLTQSKIRTISAEDIFTISDCKSITIKLDDLKHVLMVDFTQYGSFGKLYWLTVDLDKTIFTYDNNKYDIIELFLKPKLKVDYVN